MLEKQHLALLSLLRDLRVSNFGEGLLEGVTSSLHSILAAAATDLRIEVGFALSSYYAGERLAANIPSESPYIPELTDRMPAVSITDRDGRLIRRIPLNARGQRIGVLSFSLEPGAVEKIWWDSDERLELLLVEAIGENILRAFGLNFSEALERLQETLCARATAKDSRYFDLFRKAAEEAKLCWIGVGKQQGGELLDFHGEKTSIGLLKSLSKEEKNAVLRVGSMEVFHLSQEREETNCIVAIPLSRSGARLWVGIQRKGFGSELEVGMPWFEFLRSYSALADAAVLGLEVDALRAETEEFRIMYSSLSVFGNYAHELANLTREIDSGLIAVAETLNGVREAQQAILLVNAMKNSSSRLSSLLRLAMNVPQETDRRPSSLAEVIERALESCQGMLKSQNIRTSVSVNEHFTVNVPFSVMHLVIMNLIRNSIQAMSEGGVIRVSAESTPDGIECKVVDNGPGISTSIIDGLFKLGFTTKGSGHGYGLHLARHSLRKYGADLRLGASSPGRTVFCLHLPRKGGNGDVL